MQIHFFHVTEKSIDWLKKMGITLNSVTFVLFVRKLCNAHYAHHLAKAFPTIPKI
jgi:hypothetical protein